jgi:hypothetical protein
MFSLRLKMLRSAPLALVALISGCIIPGVNDEEAANGDTARAAVDFGDIAPKRITPTLTEDIPANVVQLSWTNVAGAVSYSVFLGPDTNPPLIVTVPDRNYVVRNLSECTTQYWRVVATDADGKIVSSPVWSFKTACR